MTETQLVVRSPAFGANGAIPTEFSTDGDNIPPPLVWERTPEGTQSIAIICEDPDAHVFTHWVVAGIAPLTTHFDPSAPPPGTAFGKNDHGSIGWYGPNPPSGRHRYVFRVFAIDFNLDEEGLSKDELYAAIEGHVLARGELVGTYEKKASRMSSPHLVVSR
jgi:Raf kinase inhibitor-like YbhB/YbcL family protein